MKLRFWPKNKENTNLHDPPCEHANTHTRTQVYRERVIYIVLISKYLAL